MQLFLFSHLMQRAVPPIMLRVNFSSELLAAGIAEPARAVSEVAAHAIGSRNRKGSRHESLRMGEKPHEKNLSQTIRQLNTRIKLGVKADVAKELAGFVAKAGTRRV